MVAAGGVQCQNYDVRSGRCLINVLAPGRPRGESTASNGSGGGGTARRCYSTWTSKVVPCSDSRGSWSNSRNCYIKQGSDLPGSLLFGGRTDGAVYSCTPDFGNMLNTAYSFWSATPPDGPDPAALAQEAITAMGLRAVDIGIVPDPGQDSVGLVGLPVWMWVDQPSAATFGPMTNSAAAGAVTVTATAHVTRVTWSMGDGDTVSCAGAGTPYTDSAGASPSPDCGHSYATTSVGQPGNAYTVTATSHWVIDWAGGGAAGQETMDLVATTEIQIGETQAIITA
ncbi:hypothetical protein [Quadrisphaera sp. INWT6]|uniref:hypothetical protein n=1 Tax=Quadrisphaera sp. INWT6 TaxID=2596917 RepID=UPI0018920643|nr:hypothetical protein [Quadrisphaera sp. INWT6]MBF5082406.1 hypothetical protein [Quadrisphaera sp. INWT6]